MTDKLPTGRFRRAFDLAKVGARAGAAWAAQRGTDAAARRSAEVLGNLRGLAAKIGQTASYVDGFIPPEQRDAYEKALGKLQQATPASPPEEVKDLLITELGKAPFDLFASFDETPIASASIGQVHRGTLRNGAQVAIKIQHAGIEEAVESDLRNASMLEGVLNLAGPKGLRAGRILDEVFLRFRQELDYRREANHQMAFRKLHEGDPLIRIPKVYPELSTKRVLVSEWVSGMTLDEASTQPTAVREKYAEALWRFVFRGNLVGGAFNADPHPGNYVFHQDGTVTFLDFGCVQPIPNEIRKTAIRAHEAAVLGRTDDFAHAISQMLGTRGGEFGEATYQYTRRCFAPLLNGSYRLTAGYASSLFGEMRGLKKAMSAKDGSFVAPPPELALMNRLQFGFYSVIAKLDVELDYGKIESSFLEEAASLDEGLLVFD